MNRSLILFALGTLTAAVSLAAISDPVKTDSGAVSGMSNEDASVHIFKGIPFAAPPIGEFRWKDAQPPVKWDGVKMATEFSPTCAN
jgi:para-nitrobenzyl esterase